MKGLNVKRIAAIGLGAALVGSALAPGVMAANFSNLDTLQKSNVIDASGSPVVDIVVGTIGMPEDVVWAGNIAAKVAQMAVVPAGGSGSVGEKTVTLTLGGNVTTAGSGETAEAKAAFFDSEPAFVGITTTSTQMPSLVNNPSAKYRWGSTTDSTTTVSEDLTATINASFQSTQGSSYHSVGSLIGSIARDGIAYNVNLGAGIPLTSNMTNLDGNSSYRMQIPWLGKVYTLDQINATNKSLVFYAQTTPITLDKGEKLSVKAADSNKMYDLVLTDITKTADNAEYKASFSLMDGSTTVDTQDSITSNTDLKDEFSVKLDSVYVTFVGASATTSGKAYVSLRTGTDRLELRNGYGYPYTGDNTVDSKAQWEVVFDSTTNVTKISLKNQWRYDKYVGDETDTTKYALTPGQEIVLPNNFAKLAFNGFQTKANTEVQIGAVSGISNGGIEYVDMKGGNIKVPFYVETSLDFNKARTVDIQGTTYTLWLDQNTATNAALYYRKGDYSSVTTTPTGAVAGPSVNDWVVIQNINENAISRAVSVDLGARDSTNGIDYIDYNFGFDITSGNVALVLTGNQTFSLYNKAKAATPKLVFLDTNTNNTTGQPLYVPNTQDIATIFEGNVPAYNSNRYSAVHFQYTDNNSGVANLYTRATDGSGVWNYESLKNPSSGTLVYGPTMDANYNVGTGWTSAIRDGTDYFKEAYTQDGTKVVSDNSVFKLTVPDEQALLEAYLGATAESTVAVGGKEFTGVKEGDTVSNSGTTVTVTGITGSAAAGSGVTVTKVANLVKSDKMSAYGKSILVGGWMANTKVSKSMMVGGETLESRLTAAGDYVSAVLEDGSIVVAGWTADDTATAAQALISALDGLQ